MTNASKLVAPILRKGECKGYAVHSKHENCDLRKTKLACIICEVGMKIDQLLRSSVPKHESVHIMCTSCYRHIMYACNHTAIQQAYLHMFTL